MISDVLGLIPAHLLVTRRTVVVSLGWGGGIPLTHDPPGPPAEKTSLRPHPLLLLILKSSKRRLYK